MRSPTHARRSPTASSRSPAKTRASDPEWRRRSPRGDRRGSARGRAACSRVPQRGWMVLPSLGPRSRIRLGPCHSGEYEFSHRGLEPVKQNSLAIDVLGRRTAPGPLVGVASLTAGALGAISPDGRANSPACEKAWPPDRRSVCGACAHPARGRSRARNPRPWNPCSSRVHGERSAWHVLCGGSQGEEPRLCTSAFDRKGSMQ